MIIALKNSLKVAIAIAIILAAFAAISPVVSSAPAVAAPSWCADPPCPASSRPTVPSAPPGYPTADQQGNAPQPAPQIGRR